MIRMQTVDGGQVTGNNHPGGLHPDGGYRTSDLKVDESIRGKTIEKQPLTSGQKAIAALFLAPTGTAVFAGMITGLVKFLQICWAWIS